MRNILLFSLLTSSVVFPATPVTKTNFEPAFWRFAHRDAQLLAGIDWKAMQSVSSEGTQWRSIGEMLGNVDRLLVSSPVSGDKGKSPAHMLVIASGRFDLAKLQKSAASEGAVVTSFKGVQLIGPARGNGDEIVLAIVDQRTALLGTKTVITAALDRAQQARTGPLSEENELFASAADLSLQNDFWLVSNVSDEARSDPSFIFHKVSAFASGYKLDKGVNYSIHLNADDEQSAELTSKKLEVALSQVNAYFPGAIPLRPGVGLKEIIANMKVSLEASDVHAWAHIGPPAIIPKAPSIILAQLQLPEMKASADAKAPLVTNETLIKAIRTSAAALALPALPSIPNVPAPPIKRVVRIEGLDGGIREIPYSQTRY